MDCEKARMLLDAYIDGELSEAEVCALKDHANNCAGCAEELRAAQLAMEALAHFDDQVSVPLEAQAAWRKAVRDEAKKNNTKKWMRGIYAAAAALVLVLGVNAFMSSEQAQPMMIASENAQPMARIIEKDGAETLSAAMQQDYTVRKKISVQDINAACETLQALAAEYSGNCILLGDDSCRVEIPYEYMQDYLKAASRIGEEEYSEIMDMNGDTAVLEIQLVLQ